MKMIISADNKRGQFIRFCINGCIAVANQYVVYCLLLWLMNAGDASGWDSLTGKANIAYAVSYLVSFCINFIITSYWTFHSRPSWKRLTGFGSSHLVNFFVQLAFLNLYLWLGIPEKIAAIMAMGSAVPINFAMLHFVYRRASGEERVKN